MESETYKLTKVVDGRMHYAEVTASAVVDRGGENIRISNEAFAWLKDAYGPNAWEWPVCEDFRRAATAGAAYALRHISSQCNRSTVSVLIERIHAAPADTIPSDVA